MDQPLVLHCHVPKTAGVSVSSVFYRSFHLFHLHHYHPEPTYVITPEILQDLLGINPLLKSITSHSLREYPGIVGGRRLIYVTFLRNPVAMFLSLLRYTKQQFKNLSPEARQVWPANTPALTIRELAGNLLERTDGAYEYWPLSHFFCRKHLLKRAGCSDLESENRARQKLAKQILERFAFVGIVEDLPVSLRLLKAKLEQFGIVLKLPPMLLRYNRTAREDVSWVSKHDPIGSQVLKAVSPDLPLYNCFRRRFLEESEIFRRIGAVKSIAEIPDQFDSIEDWVCVENAQGVVRAGSGG